MATTCEAGLGARAARLLSAITPVGVRGAGGRRAGGDSGAAPSGVDARVAATVLMLEVANADDDFTCSERGAVASTLREEFGLGPFEAERVVHAAARARAEAPGLWPFTNLLVEALNAAQRKVLAGILERVSEADGEVSWQESYAIRKISSLLRVEEARV